MMVTTMPTQAALSELAVLLQLLQAASDPKTSKATIDLIAAERQKYDDAIAEATLRATAAATAEADAQKHLAKCEAANKRLSDASAVLDQKKADIAQELAALEQQKLELASEKTGIAKLAQVNADLKAEQDAYVASELARLAADRKALDDKLAELEDKIVAADSVKAEYEAKLAKIKALTE